MKKNTVSIILTILGLALLGTGLYLVKTTINPQGIMRAIPFMSIGLGCGIFGHGMGEIINNKVMKNHPEIEKQMEIERNDERNTSIANKAKAKAYDMMIFVFGALMFAFALMQIDTVAMLLIVFSYLFVVGYGIYYRCKFDKEM